MLLCPVNETREDALRLYLDLLSTSPHVIPFLVTTGLFPLLLYSTRFTFSPLLAKLIDRTHTRQTPEHVPEGTSALAPYLPAPLIAVLQSESAEGLRLAMDADTVQPDMIWNATLRLHMHDGLTRLLAPFLTQLRARPDTPFPPALLKTPPLAYDALDDELCIGGVYVRPLNEIGETDLQAVHLKDPARFITELTKALGARKYAGDELGAILLSTTIVVSRHGGLEECRHFRAFPTLLALLDPDDKASASVVGRQPAELVFPLMSKASQLLNALLLLDGSDNCRLCFEAKGLDRLSHCIAKATQLDLSDESVLISIHHALASLAELIKRHPPALKQAENDPITVRSILHYTTPAVASQYPQPCMGALTCLAAMSRSDRVMDTVIKQGGMLQAVRLLVWYGAEDVETPVDEAEAEVNAAVRGSAAQLLTVMKERGNKKVQGMLAGMLTADGVAMLGRVGGGGEVLAYVDERLDDAFKQRLAGYVAEQLQAVQQLDGEDWREYSDGTFSFR